MGLFSFTLHAFIFFKLISRAYSENESKRKMKDKINLGIFSLISFSNFVNLKYLD